MSGATKCSPKQFRVTNCRHSVALTFGLCPFCYPNERRLSEFGAVAQDETGSYNAETLRQLEKSHAHLMEIIMTKSHLHTSNADEIWDAIEGAKAVRQKAGLE